MLKSNTTLMQLGLGCEDKRNNTQMESTNNPLFSILIKSTVNDIGYTGATSLSDALKSNTTLTKLDLSGEHERNNTQMASISHPLFFTPINRTGNKIGERGATSLSDALKSNTTLTELYLSCEHERANMQIPFVYKSNTLFVLYHTNSQQDWRHRSSIIERCIENEHITDETQSER